MGSTISDYVNSLLDEVPCAEFRIGNLVMTPWRFWALVGIASSLAFVMPIAAVMRTPISIVFLAAVASTLAYAGYVLARRLMGASEEHVLLEGMAVVLSSAAPVYFFAGVPLWTGMDLHTLWFATLVAFGRIGCAQTGCCYGAAAPVGILYPRTFKAGSSGRRRFPVQIVEFGLWAWLAVAGLAVIRFSQPGSVIGMALVLYSVARFGLESVRDDDRKLWCGVTQSRMLATPGLLAGLVVLSVQSGTTSCIAAVLGFIGACIVLLVAKRWVGNLPSPPADQLRDAVRAFDNSGSDWRQRIGGLFVGRTVYADGLQTYFVDSISAFPSRPWVSITIDAVLDGIEGPLEVRGCTLVSPYRVEIVIARAPKLNKGGFESTIDDLQSRDTAIGGRAPSCSEE